VIILGRDAACEISLSDHLVSKRHARIVQTGDGLEIEDLQSTNGTKVGEREVTSPLRLASGDVIEIGETQFVFMDSSTTIKGSLDVAPEPSGQIGQVHPQDKLAALLKIAGALGGTIDLDGVLARILEALFRILPQAERGFILLRGEGTDELTLKAVRDRHLESSPPIFSRTIFHHVTIEAKAVLCEDVGSDPRFESSPSVKESRIRTMICVPLWDHRRQAIGVLQVDTQDERDRFDEEDLELLVAVAGPVSVAIENARLQTLAVKQAEIEQEARDARAIQLAMIPDRHPDVLGYQFWHFYEPARSVGGDYFDYRLIPDSGSPSGSLSGRWAIAIGDVAGKGMPAALMMSRLSAEVSLLLQSDTDPTTVVERLNRSLCAGRMEDRFISFLLVVLDADRHELAAVNAGHMAPLIRRANGQVEELDLGRSGHMLGVNADERYELGRFSIGVEEVVVLYTDGITDAGLTREGVLDGGAQIGFGDERLRQALGAEPSGVCTTGEAIMDAVRRHVAGRVQFDDMTLICFGRT
jgi:serine phosphatase RsbU (regulator of sigma subunit)